MKNKELTPVNPTDRVGQCEYYLGVLFRHGQMLDVYVCIGKYKVYKPSYVIVVYPDGSDGVNDIDTLKRSGTSLGSEYVGCCTAAWHTYKNEIEALTGQLNKERYEQTKDD